VPEDRLGDLGAGRDEREPGNGRSAAERFVELDEREPEEPPPEVPPPARPGPRYTWVVGVAALIAIVVAGVVTLDDPGEGTEGPPSGAVMPDFAAPSATGDRQGVANVKQGPDDEGAANRTPACEVRGAGIVNICVERSRRPVVLTFIVPGAKDCEREVDRLDGMARQNRGVAFVAVVSGRSKGTVAELVRERRWRLPVAVDEDLALFNRYRVGFCATTVFAYRGGVVQGTEVQSQKLSEPELRQRIAAVERGPR
jgi:hypothetical protein